jgi:hypothetical protein
MNYYRPNQGRPLPYRHLAPEAFGEHSQLSIESDVYSFGVLLYEIGTYGVTPYNVKMTYFLK